MMPLWKLGDFSTFADKSKIWPNISILSPTSASSEYSDRSCRNRCYLTSSTACSRGEAYRQPDIPRQGTTRTVWGRQVADLRHLLRNGRRREDHRGDAIQVAAILQEQEHILCLGVHSPSRRARFGMELWDRCGLFGGFPELHPDRLQEAVPHGCRPGGEGHDGAVLRQATDDIPPTPIVQEGGRRMW